MHGNTPKMSKTPAADGDAKQPHLEGDLFESDAFRLFCFKILPCSKGENDLRLQFADKPARLLNDIGHSVGV